MTVELTPADEEVRVTVIDRGVGIFSGDLPRLFRAFGQLDSTSTRRHGGTGVGLYVCKTLADTLGGRIWADSTLGKGSKFSFTIPKVPPIVATAGRALGARSVRALLPRSSRTRSSSSGGPTTRTSAPSRSTNRASHSKCGVRKIIRVQPSG